MKTENKVLIGFVGIFIVTSALVGTVLVARAKYTGSASEPTIVQGNKIFAADSAPETVNKATIIPTTPYLSFASDAVNAKEENANVISIQFFGDMMLDRNVAKVMGTKGLDYLFANVQGEKRIFGDADLLIANLEGPFASKRVATSKSIAFRFDPKLAEQLKKYGFDGVSLANNHSYDMGRANVAFTRETLKKAGVGYFGDELLEGNNLTWIASETSPYPLLERRGYTASPPFKGETGEGVSLPDNVAFIGVHNTYRQPDLKKVDAAIKDAKEKAKYVVVMVHWGDEYKRISNQKQRTLARWLIDHGVDVVVGHHPHVVQEMEIYKDKPIFYSLGNFIFDQYFSTETQEGVSIGMTLADGKVKEIHILPFYGAKSQVYQMTGERREKFLEWWGKNSRLNGREIRDGQIPLSVSLP